MRPSEKTTSMRLDLVRTERLEPREDGVTVDLADYLRDGEDNSDGALMRRACGDLGHQWSARDPLRCARFCTRHFGRIGRCEAVLTDEEVSASGQLPREDGER